MWRSVCPLLVALILTAAIAIGKHEASTDLDDSALEVLIPAIDISSLGWADWEVLVRRVQGAKYTPPREPTATTRPFIFYNRSVYPGELLVHVHIPKAGGTTLFRLFKTRNCGYSTYQLKYRSYRVLRRLDRNRSLCGFFSHEFPSYPDARSFLGPPPSSSPPLRELVMIRSPVLHVISALGHLQRLGLDNCSSLEDLARSRCGLFQFGNMHNKQTRVLGNGNITLAADSLRSAFWLGIVELYDVSMCVLSFQLGQYDRNICGCDSRRLQMLNRAVGGVVEIRNPGKATNRLSAADLAAIEDMTHKDRILYSYALKLFLGRVKQAEMALGNQLMCAGMDNEDLISLKDGVLTP